MRIALEAEFPQKALAFCGNSFFSIVPDPVLCLSRLNGRLLAARRMHLRIVLALGRRKRLVLPPASFFSVCEKGTKRRFSQTALRCVGFRPRSHLGGSCCNHYKECNRLLQRQAKAPDCYFPKGASTVHVMVIGGLSACTCTNLVWDIGASSIFQRLNQ